MTKEAIKILERFASAREVASAEDCRTYRCSENCLLGDKTGECAVVMLAHEKFGSSVPQAALYLLRKEKIKKLRMLTRRLRSKR